MIDPSGVDQFVGKEGLFDVFNSISGQTVSVGPGQKALSGSTGSLMQAPASASDYPKDPELEDVIQNNQPPSKRVDPSQPSAEPQKFDPQNQNNNLNDNDSVQPKSENRINNNDTSVKQESANESKPDSKPGPRGWLSYNRWYTIQSACT